MMRLTTCLLLAMLAAAQIGCACTRRADARQLKVQLDEGVPANEVEVDLIFVPDSELDEWRKMNESDIRRYFGGVGDQRDRARKYTISRESSWMRTKIQVQEDEFVPKNSMMHLVVLARLPGNRFDKALVTLDKCAWKERKASVSYVEVTVERDRLRVLPFTD